MKDIRKGVREEKDKGFTVPVAKNKRTVLRSFMFAAD
jgi:hypothetical protein